jgi:hypothetical protein
VGDPVPRTLLDIAELDSRVQEEVSKYGDIKDFRIALWRQEPDASGSNWNARIERANGTSLATLGWVGVIPQMRERFNLR